MKILCITGKIGRVQYERMKFLRKYLPFEYDIVPYGYKVDGKYDLIYYTHYSLNNGKVKGRKIASVTSHKCLGEMKKTIGLLKQFKGISVNNTMLFDSFKPLFPKVSYTPNGVDCDFFSFKEKKRSDIPIIGWVGNKDRATKNFKNILSPLMKKGKKFKFKIVKTSKSAHRKKLRSKEQMREYYHSLDAFLVCSSTEGTPNPALEAMACGVPVFTTRVGNMVEIVKKKRNGYFVKTNVGHIQKKLNNLSTFDDDKYQELRYNTRKYIEPWDWSIKSKMWISFFDKFLK